MHCRRLFSFFPKDLYWFLQGQTHFVPVSRESLGLQVGLSIRPLGPPRREIARGCGEARREAMSLLDERADKFWQEESRVEIEVIDS